MVMGNIFRSAQLEYQNPNNSSSAFEGAMFCISLSSRYADGFHWHELQQLHSANEGLHNLFLIYY